MLDFILCSLRNLGRKKFRTALTISAIAIGVASVVLISGIGQLGQHSISQELNQLGIGSMTIQTDTRLCDLPLETEDLECVLEQPSVEDAIPILVEYNNISMRNLVGEAVVWGVDAGANQIISLDVLYGRLISHDDVTKRANVCVLDEYAANLFYGRSNIVGKTIRINFDSGYETFEIVGIAASGGNVLQGVLSEYLPSFVYIPYTTMQRINGRENYDQIAVKVQENYDVDQAGEEIVAALKQQPENQKEYSAENLAKQKERLNHLLETITMILSLIAGISLIVAGLGIMTVMLVSVHERTREIGIKKSIGAKTKTILLEFLLETFTISLIGGIIGSAVGTLMVWLGCLVTGFTFTIHVGTLLFVLLFTLMVGTVFGVYPSVSAARLSPVDALRQE